MIMMCPEVNEFALHLYVDISDPEPEGQARRAQTGRISWEREGLEQKFGAGATS